MKRRTQKLFSNTGVVVYHFVRDWFLMVVWFWTIIAGAAQATQRAVDQFECDAYTEQRKNMTVFLSCFFRHHACCLLQHDSGLPVARSSRGKHKRGEGSSLHLVDPLTVFSFLFFVVVVVGGWDSFCGVRSSEWVENPGVEKCCLVPIPEGIGRNICTCPILDAGALLEGCLYWVRDRVELRLPAHVV